MTRSRYAAATVHGAWVRTRSNASRGSIGRLPQYILQADGASAPPTGQETAGEPSRTFVLLRLSPTATANAASKRGRPAKKQPGQKAVVAAPPTLGICVYKSGTGDDAVDVRSSVDQTPPKQQQLAAVKLRAPEIALELATADVLSEPLLVVPTVSHAASSLKFTLEVVCDGCSLSLAPAIA
jgi:hypothetical protein